ncbi:beta-ketoacyl synthase chain length factor [Vaginella massiliensis]|uniref:beta-ketoacyl synthase chain length factor n=1 Tax=Vaginella massiliensis TaxID=1816680 RepID=UPI0008398430|nr:beta-ketoacyl synthase chain length factor [Vaginella massiliensis]
MKKCFVNGMAAVSVQPYTNEDFTQQLQAVTNFLNFAQEPAYKMMIPAANLRRMSKAIKMGIFSANLALKQAQIQIPDAIIVGSALGCLNDSEKFLRNLIDNQEEFLTPTAFIQSTHNTVAAQIALQLKCNAYNFTYTNGGNSFEAALLDGLMQIQHRESNEVLVGAVDEIGEVTHQLLQLKEIVKSSESSNGASFGEGATFFGLSENPSTNSFAEIVDVKLQNELNSDEVDDFLEQFLEENQLTKLAVDAYFIGKNDDHRFDAFYTSFFDQHHAQLCTYKPFSGEYHTASAYGLLLACEALKKQQISPKIQINSVKKAQLKYVVLYNHFLGKNHSIVLLRNVTA